MGVDPQQAGSDVVQFRLGVGGYLASLQGGDAAEQPPDTVGRAFVTLPATRVSATACTWASLKACRRRMRTASSRTSSSVIRITGFSLFDQSLGWPAATAFS